MRLIDVEINKWINFFLTIWFFFFFLEIYGLKKDINDINFCEVILDYSVLMYISFVAPTRHLV